MAFDPGFLGYRRDPNTGGIFFAKPSGGELLFGGEEAERMAADVDRLRGPDMRMAAYDPSAPFGSAASVPPSVPDVPGGMSAPPDTGPAMSAMPPQAAPPPPEPPAQQAPTDGGQPQPGGAAQPQYVSSTGYPTGPNGDPLFPQPTEISQYKRVAARPGGYMPTAQSETVEGAKRYSPELIEGFKSVHGAEQQGIDANYQRQHEVYRAQLEDAEAQRAALETEATNAKIKQDIVRRDVEAARSNLDQLQQAASNAKIDGGSIWGDGSAKDVGGGMLTLVAAALTGIGQAFNGGRGPGAFDVINNRISQDVAAQRAEVQRKGLKANNALAQYQRVFGDLDTAEAALRAVQTRTAATMAQKQAALMGDANAQQVAMQMAIAADRKYLEHAQQLEENVQGKSTRAVNAKYQAPSSGGLVRKTPQEIKAEVGAADAVLDYNNKARTGGAKLVTPEVAQHQNQLVVNMPGGDVAFAASPARAVTAQNKITAGEEFKRNLETQRSILEKSGDSITPEERGRYDSLVARNTLLAKQSEDLGAITASDERLTTPMTGQGGQDFLAVKAKTLAALKGAEQHVNFRLSEAGNELFRTPGDFSRGNRYDYGTRGASDDPVKVDGSIARPTEEKPAEPEKAPAPAATADESRYLSSVGGKR